MLQQPLRSFKTSGATRSGSCWSKPGYVSLPIARQAAELSCTHWHPGGTTAGFHRSVGTELFILYPGLSNLREKIKYIPKGKPVHGQLITVSFLSPLSL